MTLSQLLTDFQSAISLTNALVAHSNFSQNGSYTLPVAQRTAITEGAFLKLFVAWETFIEGSFLLYLTGTSSLQGNTPQRHAQPISHQHANDMLIGNSRFMDWTNPDAIVKVAKIYLGTQNPYDVIIKQIITDLQDMKTIRNAAAHMSSTTSAALDGLAFRKFGVSKNGITVYDFLMSPTPKAKSGTTLLVTYEQILTVATQQIANF